MTWKNSLEPNSIEQAVRKSHCSNTGKEHACIGVCTITASGITLDCQLCGKDKRPDLDANDWLVDRASAVMHAAGMRYASLSTEAQREVLKEMGKDACPNCKAIHFHTKKYEDYRTCTCGWHWYSRSGWKKPATEVI